MLVGNAEEGTATRASPEIERDDLDQWIGWALKAALGNAHPSEKVWQRIVHHITNSDEIGQVVTQRGTRQSRNLNELVFLPSYMGVEQYNPFVHTGLTLSIGI